MIKRLTTVPVTSYPHHNNGFYYVPDDYDQNPTKYYPTIIFFHGKGEAGLCHGLPNDQRLINLEKIFNTALPKRLKEGWKAQGTTPDGKVEDFIVIAVQDQYWSPDGNGMSWALKYFEGTEKLRMDKSRVYVTGLSSGGANSFAQSIWTADHPKTVTAVASYSPAAVDTKYLINIPQLVANKVPVWFSAGTDSGDSHFRGNATNYAKQINDAGGEAIVTTHAGGHCCWDQYYYGTKKISYKGKEYNLYDWFLLFSKEPTAPREPKKYIIKGTNNDLIATDGDYIPGDIIVLKGNFKSVLFRNIKGTSANPITVGNEGTVVVGDVAGYNGAAFSIHGCENMILAGTDKSEFIIEGSTDSTRRGTYFGLSIAQLSSAISVSGITIRNGGTGVLCKTSPTEDPLTWIDNPPLGPFTFRNMEIYGCVNEAMYIGDTSGYYDLTDKKQVYITPDQFDPTHKYVEQRLLKNVTVTEVFIHDTGVDGIQIAASVDVLVMKNEITKWALNKDWNHNGGILIGGKCRNVKVLNNYVHNGWGNMLQYYASGKDGATHEVANNKFIGNEGDGVGVRMTDGAHLNFRDNVVAKTGGVSFRLYSGTATLTNVTLAEPTVGKPISSNRMYIYVEPNVTPPTEINVLKLPKYEENPDTGECPECPPIPPQATPVAIETWVIMSDGSRYKI